MKLLKSSFLIMITVLGLSACTNIDNAAFGTNSEKSQVSSRNIQTRSFDSTNKPLVLRNVISTLQDLDFVIDKADHKLGSVTATKFSSHQPFKITAIVRPKGKTQLAVRINARYGNTAVEAPEIYQDFFSALSKAMFLEAHEIV